MKFIKLTSPSRGLEISIEPARIAYLVRNGGETGVHFGGRDDDVVWVRESPDQIAALIGNEPNYLLEAVLGTNDRLDSIQSTLSTLEGRSR